MNMMTILVAGFDPTLGLKWAGSLIVGNHEYTHVHIASALLAKYLTAAVPTSLATGYLIIFTPTTDCKYRYGMC